jgi:hypothetical protein
LHGFDIKHFDGVGELVYRLIAIFAAEPTEEDEEGVIKDARLFLVFGLADFGHGVGVGPFSQRYIEGVEIV